MVKILITMIAAVVISLPSAAQQERKFIRGGNDLFNKQDFEKAEVEYRKALDTEVKSYEGLTWEMRFINRKSLTRHYNNSNRWHRMRKTRKS